eukprot:9498958-Pyramimonas_sp.AAC.1
MHIVQYSSVRACPLGGDAHIVLACRGDAQRRRFFIPALRPRARSEPGACSGRPRDPLLRLPAGVGRTLSPSRASLSGLGPV